MKKRVHAIVVAGVLGAAIALSGCTQTGEADRGLPKGLPATVSVADGTVSDPVASKGNWSFVLTVKDEAAQKAAVTELTDNGFSQVSTSSSKIARTYALRNAKDGTHATLVLTKRDGKPAVVFTVVSTK
ncbi:hypothetical protein [Leifsonia sp. Le1]|uniref:hypothetical protein n=1 Tax=Leifsonia sp. Le1 TaxID=3404918 RepID=UPI003EBEF309